MATRRYCLQCLTSFAEDPSRCPNLGCEALRPDDGWSPILGSGDLLDRHYVVLDTLALGGAGIAYLARDTDDRGAPRGPELAIKVLFDQRDSGAFLKRLATEAQVLQDLAHPNIVEGRGFVHRMGGSPYLVTLYERGGSLADHVGRVGRLSPKVACGVLVQILRALEVAHAAGVVHRDLKPQNVLLREPVDADQTPRVRVADFGIAKVRGIDDGTLAGAFVGTPEYAAPEQFVGATPTAATDLFASGALLVYLLTGKRAFRFSNRADVARCHQELVEQLPPRLPGGTRAQVAALQELLEAMTRRDPRERPTVAEVTDRIEAMARAGLDIQLPVETAPTPAPTPTRTAAPSAADGATFFDLDTGLEDDDDEAPPTTRHLPPAPRGQPAGSDLDDLLAPRARTEAAQPVVPKPPPPAPDATLTAPAAAPPPRKRVVVTWRPEVPRPPPAALPDDLPALLELLGTVLPRHRPAVVDALAALPPAALTAASRAHRADGPAPIGRGLALAIAATGRADLVSAARALLTSPDPTVRCCAAEAIGAVGKASVLAGLQRLLADADPLVRACAATAVVRGGIANGRPDLARSWLAPLARDPAEPVREAALAALGLLD